MAADVLLHKATKVPVGKDQEQNLEMIRTFGRRFNHMYNQEFFPIPTAFNFGESLVKVPGLDGNGKMGKSEGAANAIYLNEDPKVLRKKVMRAVTDSGPTEMNQQKPEPIENLFTLMSIVSKPEVVTHFDELYNKCEIRYGDFKKQLAEDMITFTTPIRERILELSADEAYLSKVVKQGAEKARENAVKTIKEAREIIGFRHF
jgi:tryptophanyl-tRNA synthetase